MRSKPFARKVLVASMEDTTCDEETNSLQDDDSTRFSSGSLSDPDSEGVSYVPEQIRIPAQFELQDSSVLEDGIGVWTKVKVTAGAEFGPLECPPQALGEAAGMWDGGRDPHCVPHWMRYIRTPHARRPAPASNMAAVRNRGQVFYRITRDVDPGEELLLHPERREVDPDLMDPTPDVLGSRTFEDPRQFPCAQCGEVLPTKAALHRHETCVCAPPPAPAGSAAFDPRRHHGLLTTSTPLSSTPISSTPISSSTSSSSAEPRHGRAWEGSHADRARSAMIQEVPAASLSSPYCHHQQQQQQLALDDDQISNTSSKIEGGEDGLTTFPCENCDKSFTDPSNLQRHIRSTHVGARCHACSDCGKTFATSSGLKQHQHIHSSVKPFQCEVCLKAYTQFSNLCRHKRMHADCRQQIKCKDCGQTFSTMTSLGKHKRFCEGVLRNGARFGITAGGVPTGMGPNGGSHHGGSISGEKMGSSRQGPLPPMSAGHPTPAFPAYMPYPFGGPRNPFPFYPGMGTGFPGMFPPGHPMAAMTSPILPEAKMPSSLSHSHNHSHSSGSPTNSPRGGSSTGAPEAKRIKRDAYEYSDGTELSDLSGSELDEMPLSEVESDSGSERIRKPTLGMKLAAELRAGNGSHTRHHHSPRREKDIPHHKLERSLNGSSSSSGVCDLSAKDKSSSSRTPSSSGDEPFDLSKSSLASPSLPRSPAHHGMHSPATPSHDGDTPLDLSVSKKSQKPVTIKEEEPRPSSRKTHIFGSGRDEEKPLKPVGIVESRPIIRKPLHNAYPVSSIMPPLSPANAPGLMMNPMFHTTLDKSKLALQEAARMMACGMAPPMGGRFPFPTHHFPMGPMPGMFPTRNPMDHGKGMMPQFMKPDAFPYTPGMNKLKDRYTCKFCGKIFPRSANLTRHLRTHTGEQPYKCKYCERSFSISSNLQRHVRNIHNKEKPFKCPICDRCFGQQTNLDRHLKKHETDGPNVEDSPPPQMPSVDSENLSLTEKEESYFDEIRNFIGKTSSSAVDPEEMMIHSPESIPRSPESEAPYEHMDANFSITAQIEKHNQMKTEKQSPGKASDSHSDIGDEEDDEDHIKAHDVDDEVQRKLEKKAKLLNNNTDDSAFGDSGLVLTNGYHGDEEDEDDDDEDDEDDEEMLHRSAGSLRKSPFEIQTSTPLSFSCT